MAELNQPGFSRDTSPNLYHNPPFGTEYKAARKAYVPPVKDVYPARDSRYPAYAGPMQDARLVTDYRPQCTKNIRAGIQFDTKLWLVNHTDNVIEESRRRQVEWTGASLAMANTVPPPADIVHSNPFYSEVNPTGLLNGIGVERANVPCPALFGTFSFEPTMSEIRNNRKNIGLTTYYEGGRNSPRGAFPYN
uniref:Uncharacterized protein n=1 Tax=viral metagenome TaxID=1070528 RepID=A0A6C0DU33_9ZZZZ